MDRYGVPLMHYANYRLLCLLMHDLSMLWRSYSAMDLIAQLWDHHIEAMGLCSRRFFLMWLMVTNHNILPPASMTCSHPFLSFVSLLTIHKLCILAFWVWIQTAELSGWNSIDWTEWLNWNWNCGMLQPLLALPSTTLAWLWHVSIGKIIWLSGQVFMAWLVCNLAVSVYLLLLHPHLSPSLPRLSTDILVL